MTPTAAGPGLVRFDCYEVDLAAGRLFKRGSRIRLREQSFQVLARLLERPGEVVTREDLRRRLWPTDVFIDFENSLNAAVARLREALGDSADRPRFIETLPKRGYRFIGAIGAPVPSPGPAETTRTRLLVLPFVNLSGDAAQEYLNDAITDEMITELASVAPDALAVIARTTAMRYKGAQKDVARMGRELNVDYVLEGAARRADDHVHLTVQLIRARDQTHIFAKRYDAPMRDLFATERASAQQVAEQLHVLPAAVAGAGPVGVGHPRLPPTCDPEAYTRYAQGRYRLYRTHDEIAKAKQLLEDAIRLDPQFAPAYEAVAELYWYAGFIGLMDPRDACSKGLFYAVRAVEIDNALAETHAMLAQYRLRLDYDWAEVDREMRCALELNPASPLVRLRYGISGLMPHGLLDDAIVEVGRALELDPLSSWTRMWMVVLLYLARQPERAIAAGRTALELDPTFAATHMNVGIALCQAGRFDHGIASLREAVRLAPAPTTQGWLGLALALNGDEQEAGLLLDRFHAMAARAYVPPSSFAWLYLGLGRLDEAFAWMDKAVDACDGMMTPIKSYWFFDPIRNDPRFHALLRKMKLEA